MEKQVIDKLKSDIGVLENYLRCRPPMEYEHCFETELINDMHAAIRIIQSEQKRNEWIPVSERLPEEYKVQFLTMHEKDYTKSDDVWVTYIENNTRRTSIDYTTEGEWMNNSNVIAWRPLPEPYEEESK